MSRLGPSEQAWSLSRYVFGLGDFHDVDGRPLGERRASSDAKRGCPMELERCTYDDERKGIFMNVSALEQIRAHLKDCHADVAAFHASLPPDLEPLDRMFLAVIDQVLSPALFLMRHEHDDERVPALAATGHKLAAGLFAVMLNLETERTMGRGVPGTAGAIDDYVHRTSALIGAGGVEACAGPAKLIRHTIGVFFGEDAHAASGVDPLRVAIASLVHRQVRLGIVLRLFDELAERAICTGVEGRVRARNDFLRVKLDGRRDELAAAPVPPPARSLVRALPLGLPDGPAGTLRATLERFEEDLGAPDEVARQHGRLMVGNKGGLVGEGLDYDRLGAAIVAAMTARRATLACLVGLEAEARERLARATSAPYRFASLVAPASGSFVWFTALSGVQISTPVEPPFDVILRDGSGRVLAAAPPNAPGQGWAPYSVR